jgi:hypothetical protein
LFLRKEQKEIRKRDWERQKINVGMFVQFRFGA